MLLWVATLKHPMPPLSLPKREFMERAREIWEDLDIPDLDPEMPWYGYSLGEWNEQLEAEAQRAVEDRFFETGEELLDRQVDADEVELNTNVYGPADYEE
jgi:4-hydroxy-3-polyprenylbenzoate decarboxylase